MINTRSVHAARAAGWLQWDAMQSTGNWLVVQRLVTTFLFTLLRLVFVTVQRIYWQLSGTARELREARLPGNYERSAQVLNVLLVHKFCVRLMTTVEDFLCTHNRFEHPQYVVDNDNITLLTVNEHDAVFCETKEKGKFAGKGCHILLLERRWDVLLRL